MAAQAYGLFEDQYAGGFNHGASVRGKTDGSKTLKKGRLSGRKPLGDLSNSVKPISTQASKKPNSNVNSFPVKESAFSKVTNGLGKKKSISNALENKLHVAGRKALSDISNSGKPGFVERSTKHVKTTTKLDVVLEDPFNHDTVSKECFLHNHQECIKAQKQSIDVDEFLKIVGLDYGYSLHSSSPWPSPPRISKLKADTASGTLAFEEMAEQPPLEHDDPSSSLKLELSSPCRTPKSVDHGHSWIDNEAINFKLMGTPASLRL